MYLSIHTYRSLHLANRPRRAAQRRALCANVPLPSTSTILHTHPQRRASVGFQSWCEHLQVTTLRSLTYTSKPFTTADPITSSVVPNSHCHPPILNPNPDENSFLETSSMSDQVALQYVLLHPSLGLTPTPPRIWTEIVEDQVNTPFMRVCFGPFSDASICKMVFRLLTLLNSYLQLLIPSSLRHVIHPTPSRRR